MLRRTLTILALLTLASATLVWFCYRRVIRSARSRVWSGSKVVNAPCGLIECADVGSGSTVFAIRGASGGFDQSMDLARVFLAPGDRVVAPSRFGYLRTSLPGDASPTAQADAHASLLDALKLQKVVVIGGSMGAPSAMRQDHEYFRRDATRGLQECLS